MDMSLISKCVVAGIVLVLARVCISSKRKHLASLEGKHVVITGGSCGIGFALAKECLSQGASVTLIARNLLRLSRAADILSSTCGTLATSPHGKILLKAVDVSDATAVSVAIAECFEWKPIDILICNVGTLIPGFLDNATVNELETVIKTNILGCVYPVHAALPLVKARCKEHPSSIVLMSSLSGLLFVSGLNVYTATKYALKGLAEMLRFELMPHNIRISLVCPGFVETAMLDEVDKADRLTSKALNKIHSYNRGTAQSASKVASITMEGVKRGEFLITTRISGFLIGVLGRGFVPAESFAEVLIELLLLVPMRLASLMWFASTKRGLRPRKV